MIDFDMTRPSLFLVGYCAVVYFLTFFAFKQCVLVENGYRVQNRHISVLFYLVFAVAAVTAFNNGDFYHYREICHSFTVNGNNYGEPIYHWIIQLVDRNYLLFRMIVWGGSLVFLYNACERLRISPLLTGFLVFTGFLSTFSYARATLAFSVYYWGLSYIISNKRNLLTTIVGVSGILGSYAFHHSMVICIMLTPIAFVQINKKILVITLLLLPLICVVVGRYMGNLLNDSVNSMDNEYMESKLNGYTSKVVETANFGGYIHNAFKYSPYYVAFLIFVKKLYPKRKNEMKSTSVQKKLFSLIFCLIIVSTSTLFMGLDNNVFYYRILFMSFIPICFLIDMLFESENLSARGLRKFVMLLFVSSAYSVLYSVYSNL